MLELNNGTAAGRGKGEPESKFTISGVERGKDWPGNICSTLASLFSQSVNFSGKLTCFEASKRASLRGNCLSRDRHYLERSFVTFGK